MRCLLSTYLNVVIGNSDGFFISAQISSKFDRSLSNLGISVGGHLFFQSVLKFFSSFLLQDLSAFSKSDFQQSIIKDTRYYYLSIKISDSQLIQL